MARAERELGPLAAALERCESWRLGNGLRGVVLTDRRVPLIDLHTVYDAGSRYDPPGRSGLAHLAEHLRFRGTAGAGDLAAAQRSVGAVFGAQIHPDLAGFRATVHRRDLALALDVERRRWSDPETAGEVFATELRVLTEEHRQTVAGRAAGGDFATLHRLLYPPDHPYHRPPAGSPDELAAVRPGEVAAFVARHYRPERAVLVLVGDVTSAQARDEAERWLASPAAAGAAGRDRAGGAEEVGRPAEPEGSAEPLEGPATRRIRRPGAAARVYLGVRAPAAGSADWGVAALVVRSLALGRSSPLYRRLVAAGGPAAGVTAYLLPMRDASTLVMAATGHPGIDAEELETALEAALAAALVAGVSEALLRRARAKALTDLYSSLSRPAHLARRLARAAAFSGGDPRRLADEEAAYRRLDTAEVARMAHRLFGDRRHAILTVAPEAEAA